jgi:hypothetical protein
MPKKGREYILSWALGGALCGSTIGCRGRVAGENHNRTYVFYSVQTPRRAPEITQIERRTMKSTLALLRAVL